SFNVTGTRVLAEMASPDLLVFKSVPTASTNKAEWRAVLDAISAGQVVAELDLIATADGHWMQNPARYRIDVAAWPLAVRPRAASRVRSGIGGGDGRRAGHRLHRGRADAAPQGEIAGVEGAPGGRETRPWTAHVQISPLASPHPCPRTRSAGCRVAGRKRSGPC